MLNEYIKEIKQARKRKRNYTTSHYEQEKEQEIRTWNAYGKKLQNNTALKKRQKRIKKWIQNIGNSRIILWKIF